MYFQNPCRSQSLDKLAKELAKYFTELTSFLESLKSYSLCEWHYNQIVAKPSFIKQFTDKSNLDESKRKRVKLSNKKINPTSVDFGIQASLPDLIYESLLGQISKLESANKQLLAENKELKKRLYERFTNQQDRIQSII
ncbi:14692_t:CDS:2 [Racocetra fulgida]|uniref:14692_t:CDS:1 n=1 Tax=Racocetra fulgida TaxID=60492 RepID=A0A9N9A9J6_9GLOM|nr:14692_t:CDS:2 [Racocetra fulgida]